MMFAGAPLATVALGQVFLDDGKARSLVDAGPFRTEMNGVDISGFVDPSSFTAQDTIGQPMTCSFRITNPESVPVEGAPVRVRYHEQVLFAGTIRRVKKVSADLGVFRYLCECHDWSQILMRRMVRRNFTDMTIENILHSILQNEMLGEPLTIGTMDNVSSIPLVDARNARVFEVCRTLAGITGQTFYVDFDKAIQFVSTSAPSAPLLLNELNTMVDPTEAEGDTEAYRNVQHVVVTGTPGENEDELSTMVTRRNDEQIAERAAIEGGTGQYEAFEEITHPTSNLLADLEVLGIGYANLRLATSGAPRQTIRLKARGYGFRAGQIATVDLPTFGIEGLFVIQRVSLREQDGVLLFHDLELTSSTTQLRAYESWIEIIESGKIIVQGMFALVHDSIEFTTPGAHNWTVPAGVTLVTITCQGGSGGGAGGIGWLPAQSQNGGKGGNSGKAVGSVMVIEGQELNITVGDNGTGGAGANRAPSNNGTVGTLSKVMRSGVELVRADPGGGGNAPSPALPGGPHGAPGANGGGSGGIVTVGGGKIGGAGGIGYPTGNAGVAGKDGHVKIEW